LGILFLGKTGAEGNDSLLSVYLMIATAVITVAFLFRRAELPEPAEESEQSDFKESYWFLINDNRFRISVIAQACYVAAQVGVAAYFINYATEVVSGLSDGHAASYLSGAMLLFTLGRFTGSFLLKFTDAGMLLLSYGAINILLCAFCIYAEGMPALVALMAVFFFESIMFPTIFSLGIRDLGKHRKAGSSLLVMSIVGGALIPFLMGYIADEWSTPIAYSVPLVCFVAVSYFGFYSRQLSKP
ncbi:MAG: glucose/galactose MFS transporter, partial [Bacteroidota bacterium]